MLLLLLGFVAGLGALAILISSLFRILYAYPHISEKSSRDTYRLLTGASIIDRLEFITYETKMTQMLFPRNLTCKGSNVQMNLYTWNTILLSGDISFLKHLLQGIYEPGLFVTPTSGHRLVYPAKR